MNITVIIDFDIIGFHYYSKANKEVKFLRYKHRHLFNIKLGFKVNKLDREIEIFTMQKQIENYLLKKYGNPCDFKGNSCEMIAEILLKEYTNCNCIWVKVLEDGKGGALIEYDS